MQEKFEALKTEGKEFLRLKKAYEAARYPDAGTPAYIISSDWLKKYKEFCFYNDLKYNHAPVAQEDHFEKHAPGPIDNEPILQMESKFLKGTGTIKDFESEVMDTYLHKNVRERMDYEVLNEELWEFLSSRYTTNHTIKRYYVSKGSFYSLCEVETRFKMVPVIIVRADDVY